MKKSMSILKPLVFAWLALAMTCLLSGEIIAQDSLVKKPQKVITLKVDMDGDGNSFTIDTTIIIGENFDMPRLKAYCRGKRAPHSIDKYHNQGNMFFYGDPAIHREIVRVRPPRRGESLSDVLGDIPMRAVTSYKVKETKNGKRITIEVSDDAMDDLHEDVLIWTGDVPAPPPPPKMGKEVFIEKNIETEEKAE